MECIEIIRQIHGWPPWHDFRLCPNKLVTFKSVYMAYLKNQLDHFQLEFLANKPIPFYKKIVQKIKIMQFSIWPVTILN